MLIAYISMKKSPDMFFPLLAQQSVQFLSHLMINMKRHGVLRMRTSSCEVVVQFFLRDSIKNA